MPRLVGQSPLAPAAHALSGDALVRLVRLLGSANLCVAEVAARVLARCCDTSEQVAPAVGRCEPALRGCSCDLVFSLVWPAFGLAPLSYC